MNKILYNFPNFNYIWNVRFRFHMRKQFYDIKNKFWISEMFFENMNIFRICEPFSKARTVFLEQILKWRTISKILNKYGSTNIIGTHEHFQNLWKNSKARTIFKIWEQILKRRTILEILKKYGSRNIFWIREQKNWNPETFLKSLNKFCNTRTFFTENTVFYLKIS